jgi:hypothetical protein
MMVVDARLLLADRALDQAWRGGIGVAKAVTHANGLSDHCDVVLVDAAAIVCDRHACSSAEALSRLVFVSQYTNRPLRDILYEVIAASAADHQALAVHPPRQYRFTL